MSASNELFHLINGLSKTEKGYVKKFLSAFTYGETNCVKLFDQILRQSSPDDNALRISIPEIKTKGGYSVAKNYLFNLVLKALESYYLDSNLDLYIRHQLNQATLLLEKGRNAACDKILDRAKALALEFQLYKIVLEIISIQRRLMLKTMNFKKNKQLEEEEEEMINVIHQQKKYQDISEEIMRRFFIGGRDEAQKIQMKNLIDQPLLQNYTLAETYLSKKNYLSSHVFYHYSINSMEESYEYSKKGFQLFYEYPFTLKYYQREYLASLNNVLYTGYLLRKLDDVKLYMEKVGEAKSFLKKPNDLATIFYFNYHILNYHNAVGEFRISSALADEMTDGFDAKSKLLNTNEKLVIKLHIAYSYFGDGQFNKSLLWLNNIRTAGKLDQNPDALAFHIIFYLINHYELKNYDLLLSLIKPNNALLKKLGKLNELQINIIKLLSKLAKSSTRRDHQSLFMQLIESMDGNALKIPNSGAFEYFDFISWVQSKIERKTFSEVVKRRSIDSPD